MQRTYLPDLCPPDVLAAWDQTGRGLPAPPQVKQAIIRDVAHAWGLRFLVETGTYMGDTVASLVPEFDGLVTIELDPALHRRAQQRFAGVQKVICLKGDSGELLPRIMARVSAPTLFWLDAHYSGPETARGKSDTPILEELKTILRHPSRGHAVLIDDAREFGMDPDYPTMRDVWDLVRRERPDCSVDVAIDMVLITPGRSGAGADCRSPHQGDPCGQAPHDPPRWVATSEPPPPAKPAGPPSADLPLAEIVDFNQRSRDRWVAEIARSVPPGARVLDAGAGTCPYRSLFAHTDYKAHDFKRYEGVKLGGSTGYGDIDIVSEIDHLPVEDGAFDVVLCTEVLEHVHDPAAAVAEMARVLRPGGRLVLTAPLGSGLHQLPFHFYGGFTPAWYNRFLPAAGVRVVRIVPNGRFFKLLAQETARAAHLIASAKPPPPGVTPEILHLVAESLPRWFFGLDDVLPHDQFTAGYFVEGVKGGGERSRSEAQPASARAFETPRASTGAPLQRSGVSSVPEHALGERTPATANRDAAPLADVSRPTPVFAASARARPTLPARPKAPSETLDVLTGAGIWRPGTPLRLHFGCGERALDGYVNVDLPAGPAELLETRADVYGDVTAVRFPAGSVDEIRSHHMFEHFPRVDALALLIRWHQWLKLGGRLVIETPDLLGSALTLVSDRPFRIKMGVVRHLAGDQSAPWAFHVDHWFPERFRVTLGALGFGPVDVQTSAWPHPPYLSNVTAVGIKATTLPESALADRAAILLEDSTVAASEAPVLESWRSQLYSRLSADGAASL